MTSTATTTTTTVTYYQDSTPPTAFVGDLKTGIAGFTASQPDRIKYALYDDTTTWEAWLAWAVQNAYDDNAQKNFSARAIQFNGYWDTMGESEKSFMCIQDASTASPKGALCAEALITSASNTKTYKTKTYSIPAASVATKLTDWATASVATPPLKAATIDFSFDHTVYTATAAAIAASTASPAYPASHDNLGYKSEPAITALASGKPTYVDPANLTDAEKLLTSKWDSFQLFNCAATSITITCNNWVVASGKEADGGYQRWDNGTKVTFWWFDGRDLSDAVKYPVDTYNKIISKTVTLELQDNPVVLPAGADVIQYSVALCATLLALF